MFLKNISLLTFTVLLNFSVFSADRYWIGVVDNDWNDTGNWSTTSGGLGGASVPGSMDRVLFNANGNVNLTLDIAPTVESIDIASTYTATIDLNGNNLTIDGASTNDFENGTINNTSGGSISITCTGRTYFRGTTINPNITVTSARLFLDGSTFGGTATFTKNGASDDAGRGGNTFTGATSFSCTSTGYLMTGNVNPDTFNGVLTLTNTGTRGIYVAHNSVGTQFNQNIVINSTGASGIRIGQGGGSSTLAVGRTITVGGTGYSNGELRLRNFTQSGATAQNLSFTGTGYLYLYDSDWGGNVTFAAPRINTRGTRYRGTATITKNGASDDQSAGGNRFDGNTILNCSGADYLMMGNGSPDTFNLNLTLNNTGQNGIYIGYNAAGNYIGGNLSATNSGTGTNTWIYLSDRSTSSLTVDGNLDFTVNGTSTNCQGRVGLEGDVTIAGNLTFTKNTNATTSDVYVAQGSNSSVLVTGNLTYSQSGSGTNTRGYIGGNGDLSVGGILSISNNSSGTNSQVYVANGSTSNCSFNGNIVLTSTNAASDGIFFGNGGGSSTLAATRTITIGGGGFSAGNLYLRNFSQIGATPQSLTITSTGYISLYDSQWGDATTFTAARIFARGTTFNGNCTLTKNGASEDRSYGENVWNGNLVMNNSGSDNFYMSYNLPDSVNGNLTINNSGTRSSIFAHRATGNYISGNLTLNNTATGSNQTNLTVSQDSASSLYIGGNVIITNSGSSADCRAFLGNAGDVIVSGTLTATHSAAGTNGVVQVGNGRYSVVNIGGNSTITNSAAGATTHRIYLGENGDLTFSGTLTISNTSTATNNQIYLNNSANSQNTYNQNIILNSTGTSDGMYFGNAGGSATLAASRTISVGGSGFSSGDLRLRNFTQVGTTAQSFTNTGTGYIYLRDCNWGGNVTFSGGRMRTDGTTYQGTASLTKTGASDDRCEGGNIFSGDAVLTNSGSAYFGMGYLASDTYSANLTLNNTGTNRMYLAHNSAGNSITGNLTVTNSATGTTTYVYISNNTNSTLSIGGNTTITNSGSSSDCRTYFGVDGDISLTGNLTLTNSASGSTGINYVANGSNSNVTIGGSTLVNNSGTGTTKRTYLGVSGDVTFSGQLSISNAATATNSQVYCNENSSSQNSYNGNIIVECTSASCDGIRFGSNTGSGTLAATRTISVGGSGFIGGDLYFRNFTQVGATPQSLTNSGIGYIYNYDSDWGGNIIFSSGRINTRGTIYRGTATLTKTGASDDGCVGGNTFTGNAILHNQGTGYLLMGNGSSDTFSSDLTMNNSGTHNMYLAYNSAGNNVTGDLTINNSISGASTRYIYISDAAASTLSIGGNVTITNTASNSNSTIYFGDDGDISITGNLTATNSATGANATLSIAQASTSLVTIGGNASLTNSGTGTSCNSYFGNNGDITLTGNLVLNNTATSTNATSYLANGANSTVTVGGTASVTNSGAGTTKRVYFAQYGDVSVTSTLTLANTSTATNSQIYCNDRSGSVGTYNGNIIVESTNALSDGVHFGRQAGQGTLAATRTITVGGGGFSGGDLYFRNFTQVGATAQSLTNSGTGYIYNYDSNWGGNVTFSGGRMYTRGTTYQGTASLTKTGANEDRSPGGNSFMGNTSLINNGTQTFSMGEGSPDTFDADLTIQNNSTRYFYLARSSAGNTVGGNLIVTDNGTGTDNRIYLSAGSTSTLAVTGTTSITNLSSANSSIIYVGDQGDITFNNNVTLLNNGTGATGNIQMANNTNSAISITGNLIATNTGSSTNKRIYVTNNGDLTLSGNLTCTNNSTATTGEIYIGNGTTSAVSVGGNSIFSNTGAGTTKRIYVGQYGDITFTGNLSLLNSSSATNSEFFCNDRTPSANVYNGNIIVENSNASGDGIFFGRNQGSGVLAATRTITIGGGGFIAGQLYMRNFTQTGGTAQALALTGTGYMTQYNSTWGGNVDFEAGRFNTRGTTYSGTADLEKTGATDDASAGGNTFTGACILRNSGTGYFLMGNGTADTWASDLTMISTGTDHMYIAHNSAGNSIGGNLVSTNNGTGTVYHHISNNTASTLSIGGNATISNSGSGSSLITYFGNSGDITLTGNLTATNNPTGASGNLYIGYGSNSTVTIGGTTSVTNSGGNTTRRSYLGRDGDVTFSGNLTVTNSSSASNSQVYLNERGNSSNTYGGNIILESTNAATDGFYFGSSGGSGIQTAGGSISTGGAGYIAGELQIRNFTQLGNATSTLTLTGTARYYPYTSTFGGNMTVSTPRYYGRSATYSGDFSLTMTGSTNSDSYGDNTFNGNVIVSMESSARLRLANNAANDYNGNVTFTRTSGTLQPAYNQASTFAGNISVNCNTEVTMGSGNGRVVIDGTGNQSFNDIGATSNFTFRRMTLNKASGIFTLNEPLRIQTTATFTSGIMFSDATNLLIFEDNSTVSGASNASFVDGPVDKIGNNIFEFPVGDSTFYQPVRISAPSSNSARFRGQFFYVDPSIFYSWASKEATIEHISTVEYWTLDRIAQSNNVTVTLGWNANSGGVDNLSELTVARWDVGSGIWRDQGNGGTTGNTTTGTIVTNGAVTSFSPFTLASTTTNNPLPVSLTKFEAIANEKEHSVTLNWETSSELNNDFFTVEKTIDLETFVHIADVLGNATTNSQNNYSVVDQNPEQGVSYYRLSQTDFDGTVNYFDLQKIEFERNIEEDVIDLELFPNPNNGSSVIVIMESIEIASISLTDFLGKSYEVTATIDKHNNKSEIHVEMDEVLASGSYLLTITTQEKMFRRTFVVR